jgi:putative component of toxin-antitoxin plasmid stabilization module
MRPTFDIFITAGGHARYVETLKNLAAARRRLKQLAHNASGDCFLCSIESGIVELIVHSESPKRSQTTHSSHIVRGRLAS